MKYKVIAWTSYDDEDFPEGACSVAQFRAIIDEVKARGYDFSGYSHQELLDCAPVLNTGERMCFSSRAWGRIMAEAHGFFGVYDYSNYRMHYDDEITPEWEPFDDSLVSPLEELSETHRIEVTEEDLSDVLMDGELTVRETEALRYIDVGDTVILENNGKSTSFTVTGVSHGRDTGALSDRIDFISEYNVEEEIYCHGDKRDEYIKLYEKGVRAVRLSIE